MKLFLLTAPLIAIVSFASGYGTKWWEDDVTTRSALQIKFDDAAHEAIKKLQPFTISTTDEGQIEVGTICVTEPCGHSYPISATSRSREMIAVSRSEWGGMVYANSVFQKIAPDVYDEAYTAGAYQIGHIEGDLEIDIDW